MIFCARATHGLRRMGRERPGALLFRRTRTVKLCSFDARSKGQTGSSLLRKQRASLEPHPSSCRTFCPELLQGEQIRGVFPDLLFFNGRSVVSDNPFQLGASISRCEGGHS